MAGDKALLALAARRHGVVTTAELAALGLGHGAVARRVADGRLRRVHRGVYLVGPLAAPLSREMAAVLACGATAVLSQPSAAALWEFRPAWLGDVHVTVTAGNRHRRGIRIHRALRLDPADVTRHRGIPVTSPARTLLDLASLLSRSDLERALEEAEVMRLVKPRDFVGLLERCRGRAGANALAEALRRKGEPALTRSEAEARMLALIRAAHLPEPRTNVRVGQYEVDMLWPTERVILEVDGFRFHSTRGAFERDRRRDAALQALGYTVLRVTYRQITEEPEAVVASLAAALALAVLSRPPASGPSARGSRPSTAAR